MGEYENLLTLFAGRRYLQADEGTYEVEPTRCRFEEDTILKNVTIQILRCKDCGKYSIAWMRQPDTVEVPGGIADLKGR